jgi:hypothetical protein
MAHEEIPAWPTGAQATIQFKIRETDAETMRLLLGDTPFQDLTDAEREQAGWVRVPEDDPDYDMDYCAWRKR